MRFTVVFYMVLAFLLGAVIQALGGWSGVVSCMVVCVAWEAADYAWQVWKRRR